MPRAGRQGLRRQGLREGEALGEELLQHRRDLPRLLVDLGIGEAEDSNTLALKVDVPQSVCFERHTMAVVAEAVGLGDEGGLTP